MKTYVNLWNLTEFFLNKVSERSCREYKNTYFMLNRFSPKIIPSWDNAEIYGTVGQAIDDNIIWHRKDVICMLDNYDKSTDTHS
jgi:hypothetical protein